MPDCLNAWLWLLQIVLNNFIITDAQAATGPYVKARRFQDLKTRTSFITHLQA